MMLPPPSATRFHTDSAFTTWPLGLTAGDAAGCAADRQEWCRHVGGALAPRARRRVGAAASVGRLGRVAMDCQAREAEPDRTGAGPHARRAASAVRSGWAGRGAGLAMHVAVPRAVAG